MKFFSLLLAFVFLFCAVKKAKTSVDNSATIRFDGLYASKKMDMKTQEMIIVRS